MTPFLDWSELEGGTPDAAWPRIPLSSRQLVMLGPVAVIIETNVENAAALKLLPPPAPEPKDPMFRVVLVDLRDHPIDEAQLRTICDQTVRATRMRAGYFRGHYFGKPAYLVSRSDKLFLFTYDPEKLLWPYIVKILLEIYALRNELTHIKAAAVVGSSGQATLLVGPGSVGKTVFLAIACRYGARLLSNTHVLLDGTDAIGVRSPVRVRSDFDWAEALGRPLSLEPHIEANELVLPITTFPVSERERVPVTGILFLQKPRANANMLSHLEPEIACGLMTQYALGITTYGLKDDVLEATGREYQIFGQYCSRTALHLSELCRSVPSRLAEIDMRYRASRCRVMDIIMR